MSRIAVLTAGALVALVTACSFHEYAQVESLDANIDDYRTGCEVDADALMAGYLQYEANRFHFSYDDAEPTPTPGPATSADLGTRQLLETVWEHGCLTGRRDALGADAATLAGLRDELAVLERRLAALED